MRIKIKVEINPSAIDTRKLAEEEINVDFGHGQWTAAEIEECIPLDVYKVLIKRAVDKLEIPF